MFGKAMESDEKFDYFVCGVASALFAYLGQHYAPRRLEFGIASLEPLSLFALMLSFFAGTLKIYSSTLFKKANANYLSLCADEDELRRVLLEDPGFRGAESKLDGFKKGQESALGFMRRQNRKTLLLVSLRDVLLCLGFVFLLSSKLLLPYAEAKPSEAAPSITNRPPAGVISTNQHPSSSSLPAPIHPPAQALTNRH